jgi:hypothetical protein
MGSISRYAAWGAGLGAIRGATDNIIGEDRTSVLGGALQGAIMFGGLRAMKVGFNTMAGKKIAKNVSKSVVSGSAVLPKVGDRTWSAGGGLVNSESSVNTVNPFAAGASKASKRRSRRTGQWGYRRGRGL